MALADNIKLLQSKIEYLQQAYIVKTDASERFNLKTEITELEQLLAGLNERQTSLVNYSAGSSHLVPVERAALDKRAPRSFLNQMGLKRQNKESRLDLMLEMSGAFDYNSRLQLLAAVRDNFPIPCRDEHGLRYKDVVNYLLGRFSKAKRDERFFLLLGEAGTGKSTALINLFYQLIHQGVDKCILIQLAEGLDWNDLNIPDQENCVLILDSLDEHPQAQEMPEQFLADIEHHTRNFKRVILSCRSQFFTSRDQVPRVTTTFPNNPYLRIELDLLDEKELANQIQRYINPLTQQTEFRTALAISREADQLFNRPLLLPFLKEMVKHSEEFVFWQEDYPHSRVTSYEIYERVIDQQLSRELKKWKINTQVESAKLKWMYSLLQLAKWFYQREEVDLTASVYFEDWPTLKNFVELKDDQLYTHALLHRDGLGNYRFAHRTYKEYFYAVLLFHTELSEASFPFYKYPSTLRFYQEMVEVNYHKSQAKANSIPVKSQAIPLVEANQGVAVHTLLRTAGIPAHRPVALGLEYVTKISQLAKDRRDVLTDLAWKLIRSKSNVLPTNEARKIAARYGMEIGDLLSPLLTMNRYGLGLHFLHRSIAEYLVIRDILTEGSAEEIRNSYLELPQYPFKFRREFFNEIQWLEMVASQKFPRIAVGYRPNKESVFSTKDQAVSTRDLESKGLIGPTDYFAYVNLIIKRKPVPEQAASLAIRSTFEGDIEKEWIPLWPHAKYVGELDIALNDLKGELDLRSFQLLERLRVIGSDNLDLENSIFPSKLKQIFVSEGVLELPSTKNDADLKFSPYFKKRITGQEVEKPVMIKVAGGTFWMGVDNDLEADNDESPAHLVKLSDFEISKEPITVRQYAEFVRATNYVSVAEILGYSIPIFERNDENAARVWSYCLRPGTNWRYDPYGELYPDSELDCPVIHISWLDAIEYCKWLNRTFDGNYRLPTEAEWEYAVMGGQHSTHKDEDGNVLKAYSFAGGDQIEEIGWYKENIMPTNRESTRPVGLKNANELGLLDMTGNVCEWVLDSLRLYKNEEQVVVDPIGTKLTISKIYRGGSWGDKAKYCRNSYRNWSHILRSRNDLGFRVVASPLFLDMMDLERNINLKDLEGEDSLEQFAGLSREYFFDS